MGRFPEQFVEQVAMATDIVDLVSQYVALKQRGREFVGLCPFHDDRKPSMYVAPAKQLFKCFACGAGGGVFQWLMLYEKLSFPEAVEALAERANLSLPQEAAGQQAPPGSSRTDLLRLMQFAADFYRAQLRTPCGQAALEYAYQRGLDDSGLERFGIGYSPPDWQALLHAARRKGYSAGQLVQAGLAAEGGREGCYDRFRNRLIFPILDAQERVIAFGGRAMSDEERAKYLNSPESALFDKSNQLYALNWAREGIVRSAQAVVAEGYFDAIIPMHHGLDNFVATLGTSLTERHVRLLSRYAREVVLLFDADQAGIRAAQRALEMFLMQQMQVRVATIPAGKDPADYCLLEGPEALRRLVAEAPDALAYVWGRCQQRLAEVGEDLAGRRAVVEDFLRLVAESEAYGAIDEVRRSNVAQHIAHLLNVPAVELQQQIRRLGRRARTRAMGERTRSDAAPAGGQQTAAARADGASHVHDRAERHVLEVLLSHPSLFDLAMERVDWHEFEEPLLQRIARTVWAKGEQGRLSLEEVLASEDLADCGHVVAELATAGERRGNPDHTLAGATERMAQRRQRGELEQMKSPLDDEALRGLGDRLRSADNRRMPRIRG